MHWLRRALGLSPRLCVACVAMLGVYLLSTSAVGSTNITLTPEEAAQAGRSLGVVSVVNALMLSLLVLCSPWSGLKLIGALILVIFGVETFMTQIETLYFNRAVQMPLDDLIDIVGMGAARAILFAPTLVLIMGRVRPASKSGALNGPAIQSSRLWILAVLAVAYVIIYFTFGYFVAWQWEETRIYYTGSSTIKPFSVHFQDLFIAEDPMILPFQLVRGAFWSVLAFLIVRMTRGSRWLASLSVALIFATLVALPIGLFPNPYMPAAVRQAHFVELATSMLLFGALAGWTLHGPDWRTHLASSPLDAVPHRLSS